MAAEIIKRAPCWESNSRPPIQINSTKDIYSFIFILSRYGNLWITNYRHNLIYKIITISYIFSPF